MREIIIPSNIWEINNWQFHKRMVSLADQIPVVVLSPSALLRRNSAKNLKKCESFGLNMRSFTRACGPSFRMTKV